MKATKKINWFAVVALVVGFAALVLTALGSSLGFAENITSWKFFHQAEQEARTRLRAEGCLWATTAQTNDFKLTKTTTGYKVVGATIEVRCVERSTTQNPVTTKTISVTWTHPVTRVDGSVMKLAEIAGYNMVVGTKRIAGLQGELVVTGSTVTLGQVQASTMEKALGSSYYIQVQTIDTNKSVSAWSDVVVVSI